MSEEIKNEQNLQNEVNMIDIAIERDSSTNLKISLKSNQNWATFARSETETFFLGGVECFIPKQNQIEGVDGNFSVDNSNYMVKGFVNLSLLLAKDIKNGVVFNFGAVPITEEGMISFFEKFRFASKILYLNCLKPLTMKATITCQIIEKEEYV